MRGRTAQGSDVRNVRGQCKGRAEMYMGSTVDPRQSLLIRVNAARVVGAANIDRLYPYLFIFLNSPETEVVKAAILAAGESRHEMFLTAVISHLKRPELEAVCGEALTLYGSEIVNSLADCLFNPMIDYQIRRRIPLALSLIANQAAVDVLQDNLTEKEPVIRFEIIRALNRIRQGSIDLAFDDRKLSRSILDEANGYMTLITTLYHQIHQPHKSSEAITQKRRALAKAIEVRLDQNIERIFRLLGLKYPDENIYHVYKGFKSEESTMRANVVEFLDNVLEVDLKRTIIPIIETTMIETVIDQVIERLGLKVPDEREAYEQMLPEAAPDLQLQAIDLITDFKDPGYVTLAGELLNAHDAAVRQAALHLLRDLGYLPTPGRAGEA